jgi:dynein heavy chain
VEQEGVFVYGLFLEGAGWDRRNIRLIESATKVLYVLMPVIHIFALHDVPDKSPKLYQVSMEKRICDCKCEGTYTVMPLR